MNRDILKILKGFLTFILLLTFIGLCCAQKHDTALVKIIPPSSPVLAVPPPPPPSPLPKPEALKTISLTDEKLTAGYKKHFEHILQSLGITEGKPKIDLYKDKERTKKYTRKELTKVPGETLYIKLPKQGGKDSEKVFSMGLTPGKGLPVNTMTVYVHEPGSGEEEWAFSTVCLSWKGTTEQGAATSVYYAYLGHILMMDTADMEWLKKICVFAYAGHKNVFTINDSTMAAYAHKTLANINMRLYRAAVDKKVISYGQSGELMVPDSLKTRAKTCETVSIQIDPNDPYNTKDSTVCTEYNPNVVRNGMNFYYNARGQIKWVEAAMTFKIYGYGQDSDSKTVQLFEVKMPDAWGILGKELEELIKAAKTE